MKIKVKKSIITFLKGLIIGGTMTVPGVSGGSMAMILGIYDKLITSFNKSLKLHKKSIIFFITCIAGVLLGMVTISRYILKLMEAFPMVTQFFFIGAVLGGAPMIYKAAQVKKFSPTAVIYPLIGLAFVLLIGLIPDGAFMPGAGKSVGSFLIQIFGGILVAFALVLPGISLSQMLLMLGIYETVMSAISTLNILPLIPIGIGALAGVLLFAKGMEYSMNKYPKFTYLSIFGFVLGSVKELFPGVPSGMEILFCIVSAALGFAAIYFISEKTAD